MATFKYGTNSLLALTSRVTTPSLHIQKNGNHWYVPLFSGNKGAVVQNGDYAYTLGGLKVGSYRAVIGREVIKIHIFTTQYTTWILTSNGELYGCGYNDCGQQGYGVSGESTKVLIFTKRASNVKEVSCSRQTTWYIDNNGNLYGCGMNGAGAQGTGDRETVLTFTKRASNVKEVSCSIYTTLYIDNNNDLYGCGNNAYGQLGSGDTTNVLTFTKIASNVKKVRCTRFVTWYIDNNNNLYGSGYDDYGQQGYGEYVYNHKVFTFTKRASNVKEVSCTDSTTWYIDNNGNLYGCGANGAGQQGSGDTTNVFTFTKRASNVKKVSCSGVTTWYIDNNNDLYGCGQDADYAGQQGSGVSGGLTNVLVFTKRASNVKEVRCSDLTTWYIDNNNDLYGCGSNNYGQQGSGDTTHVFTFTKRASNVKEVRCSQFATWYIDNNDNHYGCGDNAYGQQGSGDRTNVKTFTKRDL